MSKMTNLELEQWLETKCSFKHNVVHGKVEYKGKTDPNWRELTGYKILSILRELSREGNEVSKKQLMQTLYSDFVPQVDPFKDYFSGLPQWDQQTDYIKQLENTVTVSDEEKEIWGWYLRKWLMGVVACATSDQDTNQTVLTFIGAQGIGKTKWMDKLVPRVLNKYYYSGTINPNDKDTKVNLSECLLINLDELENLNRGELGSLKQLITQSSIRIRRPYAEIPETIPRRASFMGSVNNPEFLKDGTGNRRFLCVEALNIDYEHTVDMSLVYAQAYHILLHNLEERYWFNSKENERVSKSNEKYKMSHVELEFVLEYFRPCDADEEPDKIMTTTDLQKFLLGQKNRIQNLNIRSLGIAMRASSFTRTKIDGKWKWKLKKIA